MGLKRGRSVGERWLEPRQWESLSSVKAALASMCDESRKSPPLSPTIFFNSISDRLQTVSERLRASLALRVHAEWRGKAAIYGGESGGRKGPIASGVAGGSGQSTCLLACTGPPSLLQSPSSPCLLTVHWIKQQLGSSMWVTDCSLFTPGENHTDTVVIIARVGVIVRVISEQRRCRTPGLGCALMMCHRLVHIISWSLFFHWYNLDE